MLKRLGWVAILIALCACFLMSCGGGSGSSTAATTSMYVVMQGSAQIFGYRSNINTGALSSINGSPFNASPAALIVTDPAKTFAYVATATQINPFGLNLNGSLTPVSNGPTLHSTPLAMTIDSAGKFLLVSEQASCTAPPNPPDQGCIQVFSIGSGAALAEVSGSPFIVAANPSIPNTTTADPTAMGLFSTVDSSGGTHGFLYVVNGTLPNFTNGQVSIFSFDSSTGAIGIVSANFAPLPVGTTPSAIAVSASANGNFVYVANAGNNNISGFAIDLTQGDIGNLIPVTGSPFPAGLNPVAAAIDPSNQFVYVVDQNSNQVSGYRITRVSGKLVPLSNSPFNTGAAPVAIGISPTNKFLYVSNNSANTISAYSIDPPSGNIGPISSAVSTGSLPAGIAFGK
jgi:6-phosphogluconolactonase